MKDIVQSLQHWATENLIESKYEEEGENEQKDQYQEADESPEQKVNYFGGISYREGEEGESKDIEEIHMSQNIVTTTSARKNTSSDTPAYSNPPRISPHTQ